MKVAALLTSLLLALPACGAREFSSESTGLGAAEAKSRPVSGVVKLLQGILRTMEEESERDEEVYDKFACWCETNEKLKSQAIGDARDKIDILLPKIEDGLQLSSKLQVEVQHESGTHVKLEASFDRAASIRHREALEFGRAERDLLQSISALKAAIVVLSKHHVSLLQVGTMGRQTQQSAQMAAAMSALRSLYRSSSARVESALGPAKRRRLASFLGSASDYFGAEFDSAMAQLMAARRQATPQSGEIIGILKQMLATFQEDLKQAQDEEGSSMKAFQETQASLKVEIGADDDVRRTKSADLADAQEKLAMWQKDVIDTRVVMRADVKFLKMLKERCEMMAREWEARQHVRGLEVQAVSKALAVLNSDDAQQTFSRTFDSASLLQLRSERAEQMGRQSRALRLLGTWAAQTGRPRLAAFATRAQSGAFVRVKAAIRDMISELGRQQAEESKHRDFCVDQLSANEAQAAKKKAERTKIAAAIEDLRMTAESLAKDIAGLKKDIADTEVQLKRAGQDREREHNEFQAVVADQRATQQLLREALRVLKGFYDGTPTRWDQATELQLGAAAPDTPEVDHQKLLRKALRRWDQATDLQLGAAAPETREVDSDGGKVVIVRQKIVHEVKEVEAAGPAPPPGFSVYKQKEGGVMGMIKSILADAKAMEAEAIRDEESSQKTYEDFVKDSNGSILAATEEIVNKSAERAKLAKDLAESEQALSNAELELEQLVNYRSQLHESCDYIVKNFQVRREARSDEVGALRQALVILSEEDSGTLLQGPLVHVDPVTLSKMSSGTGAGREDSGALLQRDSDALSSFLSGTNTTREDPSAPLQRGPGILLKSSSGASTSREDPSAISELDADLRTWGVGVGSRSN